MAENRPLILLQGNAIRAEGNRLAKQPQTWLDQVPVVSDVRFFSRRGRIESQIINEQLGKIGESLRYLQRTPFKNAIGLTAKVDAAIAASSLISSPTYATPFLDEASSSVITEMSTAGKRPKAGESKHDFVKASISETFDAINAKEQANIAWLESRIAENPSLDYSSPVRHTAPTTRQNLFDLGIAYAKVGQKDIAEAIAARSNDFVRTQIEAELAFYDLKSGDTRAAEKFLNTVVADNAARLLMVPDFLPQYAEALAKQGRQEEAMALWGKVEKSEVMQKSLRSLPAEYSYEPTYDEIERALLLYTGAKTLGKAGANPWDGKGEIRRLVDSARAILEKYGAEVLEGSSLSPTIFPQFNGSTLRELTSEMEYPLTGRGNPREPKPINPVRFVQYAPVIEALQK